MYRSLILFILINNNVLGTFSTPESCYYCFGTPQCGDPMDYNEVSPRECPYESVCLKYVSSSKNSMGDVVADELTYRECFQASLLEEDTCSFVKGAEEELLRKLNHTLTYFLCEICTDTNCNVANRNRGSLLSVISLFLLLALRSLNKLLLLIYPRI